MFPKKTNIEKQRETQWGQGGKGGRREKGEKGKGGKGKTKEGVRKLKTDMKQKQLHSPMILIVFCTTRKRLVRLLLVCVPKEN